MKVLVTSEYRFVKTPDGRVWTQTAFPYSYWKKYLKVFDEVLVLARASEVPDVDDSWKQVTGECLTFRSLPSYRGPLQYIFSSIKIFMIAQVCLKKCDAAILSVPSPIAIIIGLLLLAEKKRYAVEVMGDPWEVLGKNGVTHPVRPILRIVLTVFQKWLVRSASSVAYVTQKSLQRRYPSSSGCYSIGVSNVDLNPADFATSARTFPKSRKSNDPWKLVSVGSLEQLYKGPDLLLRAMALLKNEGLSLRLTWAGGGSYLPELRNLAKKLGVSGDVNFLGQVSGGQEIRSLLDDSDIFILASRTEGLPRAMVEAMARGLPCLGASVGGIPELLDSEQLFPAEDVASLAKVLRSSVMKPEALVQMSSSNLEKSREFTNSKLETKWSDFLRALSIQLDNKGASESD